MFLLDPQSHGDDNDEDAYNDYDDDDAVTAADADDDDDDDDNDENDAEVIVTMTMMTTAMLMVRPLFQIIHLTLRNKNKNDRIQRLFEIFYNLLTAPRTVSNTVAQVAWAQSCANHVQHIERLSRASVMLRATWYEGTAQLLRLTELKWHLFELYFVG